MAEVVAALNKLKSSKAPGICNITPEMLKAGSYTAVQWLTNQAIYSKQSGMEAPFLRIGKKGIILPFYEG